MSRQYVPVLTIAGSDCSGGAGIQADIKTIAALGGYAEAVITAVTAQNTTGVSAIAPIAAEVVRAQIAAVITDIPPRAVKIGMTGTAEVVEAIADSLSTCRSLPVVVDPVMVSTSGSRLAADGVAQALMSRLFTLCTLLTPNLPELEQLSGHTVGTPSARDEAARWLLDKGCRAVLVKGGHQPGSDTVTDWLYRMLPHGEVECRAFAHARIDTQNTHGTGCTLSSAIATRLAMGEEMCRAVEQGIDYLCGALAAGHDIEVGRGHGPVCHHYRPLPAVIRTES